MTTPVSWRDQVDRLRTSIIEATEIDHSWHCHVTILLSRKRGDSKCRLLAAKLFSNLVASNEGTAQVIVESLPIAPDEESVSEAILERMSHGSGSKGKATWVDIIMACSSHRESLAAVIAALYNCITSSPQFPHQVACHSMMVTNLLRQFISVDT